uniref:Transmembrane protein 54 n=1 Tax=Oncorhynchus kisutch TaxID=8019 RepID=A0A8C7JBG2_ONCKI
MANTGRFCASLEQPKALMKMGLSMVLVGHVNFLLGALVHGAVLRHINLNTRAHTMAYSISNIMALTTGLVGVVVGMLAILLCKNKKSRVRTWSLFVVSMFGSLLATASAIGLTVSVVRVTVNGGRTLLTQCRFPKAIGYASITNECPFDHTRVYSMTLILWVPLIVICIVQLVLSVRCFSVCVSFLGLPCFPRKIRLRDHGRTVRFGTSQTLYWLLLNCAPKHKLLLKSLIKKLLHVFISASHPVLGALCFKLSACFCVFQINAVAPAEPPSLTSSVPGHPLHIHLLQSDPPHLKSQRQPLPPPPLHHSCPSHLKSQRQLLPPPPPLHHSNPSHLKSQRQPLRPQHQNQRGSSDRWSDGGQLVPPEEHELLEQGFWI